jgi:hypothetical protein
MRGWGPQWFPLTTKAEMMYRLGAAYNLITMLEDRCTNLEQALADAGIAIPIGFARAERERKLEALLRKKGN